MKIIKFYNHKNVIFKKLSEIREMKNISQQDLASRMQIMGVNIDQQAISKIELDKRIVTNYELMCICKILNIDINDLLFSFEDIIS